MKSSFLLLVFSILMSTLVSAQLFNNAYVLADQPPSPGESKQHSMVVDAAGNVVTVHNIKEGTLSDMPEAHNVEVLKVDQLGNTLWSNFYGELRYDDQLHGICVTDDGGYLLVGSRGKSNGETRNWILRLDSNGSIVWERLFLNNNLDVESLMVARTSEASENYFVVGQRQPEGIISAMKISSFGLPIWSNFYLPADLIGLGQLDDLPTSLVEDPRNNGFVIAGLQIGDRIGGEQNGPPAKGDGLFTIGVRLDGTVFSDYQTYDVFASNFADLTETEPHINTSLDGNSFVMAFGATGTNQGEGQNEKTSISYMPLQPNLLANQVLLYSPSSGRNARAHSIYPDANGFYALGCTSSDSGQGTLNGATDERVSFLKILPNGNQIAYRRYNPTTNARSRFMVQDVGNANYYLKTDLAESGLPGMGLIQTDFDGNSNCTITEIVDGVLAGVRMTRIEYAPYEFNSAPLNFPALEWNSDLAPMPCTLFGNNRGEIQDDMSTAESTDFALKAYPTILSKDINAYTIDFTLLSVEKVKITVINTQGQISRIYDYEGAAGMNSLQLKTADLSIGVNTIILKTNAGDQAHTRVIMQ